MSVLWPKRSEVHVDCFVVHTIFGSDAFDTLSVFNIETGKVKELASRFVGRVLEDLMDPGVAVRPDESAAPVTQDPIDLKFENGLRMGETCKILHA